MKSLKKVGVLFTLLITTLAMVGCASTTTEEKSTAMKTVQTDKGEWYYVKFEDNLNFCFLTN
ncbi:hypothetical protein, partial [Dubosiella newyorkensis]|uniref:hypothetical protein n=1 Tax=Dubosiella newyorkensis TaxID=1862672 RepID=UPI0023F0A787